jgi:hypothetical protein
MKPALVHRRPAATPVVAAGLAALLALLALPAGADWLVTREGARIETRGTWKIQGKLVVFTRADGTLASVRADQLDLEASAKVTAAAQSRAEKPPVRTEAPRRKSVVVLTDKDFKPVTPPDGAAPADAAAPTPGVPGAPGSAGAADKKPAAPASGSKLEIVSWERVEQPGTTGVVLNGTVRNNSQEYLLGLQVTASFLDDAGTLLVQQAGTTAAAQLKPGESTTFVVRVDGTLGFASVQFEAKGTAFQLRQKPPAEGTAPPPGV